MFNFQLAFLTADIFASLGYCHFYIWEPTHCKMQQFIPVVICILVILLFQQWKVVTHIVLIV